MKIAIVNDSAMLKKHLRRHRVPVMIVSYKDRPEGSFHDRALLEAVTDLTGERLS